MFESLYTWWMYDNKKTVLKFNFNVWPYIIKYKFEGNELWLTPICNLVDLHIDQSLKSRQKCTQIDSSCKNNYNRECISIMWCHFFIQKVIINIGPWIQISPDCGVCCTVVGKQAVKWLGWPICETDKQSSIQIGWQNDRLI